MEEHKMPDLSKTLFDRIRLVRRDLCDLLFHFTHTPEGKHLSWKTKNGGEIFTESSPFAVLRKILDERNMIGTSKGYVPILL